MMIKKAIFPVAGLGTRFLPATKAQPKEMLPVVDKPLIQYAVEEAYAAGVREMIFVTGRHKRPIEDHFDMTFELEVALEQAGKDELLRVVRSVKPHDMECIYVRQAQALGLGVNAGHDLSQANLLDFLETVPDVLEVSIGHALISDALELGYGATVQAYQACIDAASAA